jgi:hypothetical protein
MEGHKKMTASARNGPAYLEILRISCALLAVTSAPYLYARFATTPGKIYTGLMYDVPDHAQYWSWVTESRHALFISNTMTPEPNPAVFMNPMMWALARLQTALGLSFPALFQAWRIVAVLALVGALVLFLRAAVPEPAQRKTALWLSLFGAGFGWILVAWKVARRLPDVPFPADLYTIEPNTFWGLLSYPYIALAQGLLLFSVLLVWRAHRRPGVTAFLLAGVASLALALVHAYDLIILYAVVAAFGCALLLRDRRLPMPLLGAGVTVAVFSAPMALYFRSLTANDPLWRSILAQYSNAGVWTPPHVHLLVLMGLPLVLAAAALARRGPRTDEALLVSAWAVVGLALIYLPVVFQIKMLGGWQFPLAILAAKTWHGTAAPAAARGLTRSLGAATAERVARVALLLIVIPTNVCLYAWRFVELRRQAAPYYLLQDEAAALDWLARNATPEDVVLAPEIIGQFVPNYGQTRAYLAHWAMTNRYHERVTRVKAFFTPNMADEWRADVMKGEGVTMVLRAGSIPGLPQLYDFSASPWWEPVFSRPNASIYRLRPESVLAGGAGQVSAEGEPGR